MAHGGAILNGINIIDFPVIILGLCTVKAILVSVIELKFFHCSTIIIIACSYTLQ